mmetsp:Transcript_142230/g.262017  ORF Transcript_142230/g.262017 Transcript_142230/m.262017 type:complete len:241 (-) Transcript_142230:1377-2099(-)
MPRESPPTGLPWSIELKPSALSTKIDPSSPADTTVRQSALRHTAKHGPLCKPCSSSVSMENGAVASHRAPSDVPPKSTALPSGSWLSWYERANSRKCPGSSISPPSPSCCVQCVNVCSTDLDGSRKLQQDRPLSPAEMARHSEERTMCSWTFCHVCVLHSSKAPSSPHVRSTWSLGSKHKEVTCCEWPRRVVTFDKVLVVRITTSLPVATANKCPPFENLTIRIPRIESSRCDFRSLTRI